MQILSACPVKNLGGEKFFKKFLSGLIAHGLKISVIFNGACLVLILFLLTFTARPVFAHTTYSLPEVSDGQINEALQGLVPLRFLPSEPLYFTITVKESIQRFFQPSAASRAQFDLVLSGKRIKEGYLLLEKGDVKNSSETLDSYSERLLKMVAQLEKARSQNQEVAPLVDRIAHELEIHETLLSAIYNMWREEEDAYDFDSNFTDAIFGFSKAVGAINNVRPGLKDRYMIPIEDEVNTNVVPYITPPVSLEASPSVRPRRIIY